MVIAIRQSDYDQIKYITSSTSFSDNEIMAVYSLANEIIADRKTALENRKLSVIASLILKVTGPLTFFGGLIGFYMDPRGLGAIHAISTGILSLAILAPCAAPFIPKEDRVVLIPITLAGTASAAATYGLIKLEQYFWKRARKIDQELQQALEKAIDCKNLLISTFGADNRSADII